ncbi:MAG: radical SAM/SPASM domain-containing protein [Thermodesulfobacteriota bacterium]
MISLLPKILQFKAARAGLIRPGTPVTLTYSVTAACQSNCKTCNIGLNYQKNPNLRNRDLSLTEIEKIFRTLGQIYFFNISGGEPFLRKDLPQIIKLACEYLKPHIIHIPTNAIAAQAIHALTAESLEIIRQFNPKVQLTVKPSIDGIGIVHDNIRGVPGNFDQLKKTINRLKLLETKYSNFHIELGTVISNFNIHHIRDIEDYVHSLGIQSYRNEIAERRAEFFNLEDNITPDVDTYERLILEFSKRIRRNLPQKRYLTKITESLRLVYYELAIRILKEQRQVIPCFAGISNVHINYDGEVWPCCVLGYNKPMGSLRQCSYNFKRLWHSNQANRIRKFIRDGKCACPLANQAYSNILCRPTHFLKVIKNVLSFL